MFRSPSAQASTVPSGCLQAGNPCLHSSITSLKSTYSKQMWQLGYATRSATSLTGEQYGSLMQQLHSEACSQLSSLA